MITKAVDLDGTVAMEATLSEATGGWKSLFVKPFNWLFAIAANRLEPSYRFGLRADIRTRRSRSCCSGKSADDDS